MYDSGNVEDIDTTQEDHIYDMCRYVLMENPISPPKSSGTAETGASAGAENGRTGTIFVAVSNDNGKFVTNPVEKVLHRLKDNF